MAAQETWVVFGRREYQEALTQIGTLEIERGRSVEDGAKSQYGADWLELVAIPQTVIRWAIREE